MMKFQKLQINQEFKKNPLKQRTTIQRQPNLPRNITATIIALIYKISHNIARR